jgi:prolyl oligopeptidase
MKTLVSLALAASAGAAVAADSDYEWLEAPHDAKALAWARAESAKAKAAIGALPGHAEIGAQLQTALRASDPPPHISLIGSRAVRFSRSTEHPHGVLDVADRDAKGVPGAWRTVLDVDALRKTEGKPYELRLGALGEICAPPTYTRCLLSLSPGGGDDAEIREFDLTKGAFVEGGFRTPATRGSAIFLGPDQVLIQHRLDASEPATIAGWSTAVHLWKRGAPLAEAPVITRIEPTDAISTLASTDSGAVLMRAIDYSTFTYRFIDRSGQVSDIDLPRKLKMGFYPLVAHNHLIVQLSAPAVIGGVQAQAEAFVAYDLSPATPKDRRASVVYTPAQGDFITDAFAGTGTAKDTLYAVVDHGGLKRLVSVTGGGSGWQVHDGATAAPGESLGLSGADPLSDDLIVSRSGYLTPTRLELVRKGQAPHTLFTASAGFDASKLAVEVKQATSRDGTSIDYYLLRPKTRAAGPTPTLMTGYAAFGISVIPGYLDNWVGGQSMALWLERGGALVVPMARGGGERGAAWQQAAMREKRQNSYDDFAAVAETLIKDGFTDRNHLGIFGSSNGGLLAATMGTQRPDLFAASVVDVPLTDLFRMSKMGMGGAWVDEYGDPNVPAQAAALQAYSPFQNVRAERAKDYPVFLVTVSTEDNRVGPGHARKFAAKLQDAGAKAYYIEDEEGGHGVSDPLSRPDLMADRMTFLIDTLMK